MTSLHWQTIGSGKHDLVMLHGWGLNADVWQSVVPLLSAHFRVHLVDLPGYGRSQAFPPMSLSEMVQTLRSRAPRSAIWLGWSLGGLVATKMALEYPDRVSALITVASSPCFIAQQGWPGIKAETLRGFQHQMSEDFQRTVERFIALQAIGSASAKDDIRQLRQVIVDWPVPSLEVLTAGLNILIKEDLRSQLSGLTLPMLRLYGALDGLVPRKIVPLLDPLLPESRSVIFAKAAHAPFISHAGEFCHEVIGFHKHGVFTDDV